jgi:hypothetical protein
MPGSYTILLILQRTTRIIRTYVREHNNDSIRAFVYAETIAQQGRQQGTTEQRERATVRRWVGGDEEEEERDEEGTEDGRD